MATFSLRPLSNKIRVSLCVMSSFCTPVDLYRAKTNNGVIKPDPKQLEVVDKLELLHQNITSYCSALSKIKDTQEQYKLGIIPPKGMYIHGEVGTGKTMLMEMLYDSLPKEAKKFRTHFHSFMIDLLSKIHKETMNTSLEEDSPMTAIYRIADDIAQSSSAIFIDELQFTDYTSNAILLNLFESLFNKGVVVIATSNRPISELGVSSIQGEGQEDNPNMSELGKLIQKNCELACLESKYDYRLNMIGTDRKYYHPLTPKNKSQMSALFEETIKGKSVNSVYLNVYGRKVRVPEATECGVCRFEFTELCCSPLGSADYIKICNSYHTIFLSNIPVLYFHNKNEARRLINFIDAAYESRVKLYCSAEARPEDLLKLIPDGLSGDDPLLNEMLDELAFSIDNERIIDQRRLPFVTGRDEIFAFRRAISRLNEMQSSVYAHESHRQQYFDPYISTDEDQRRIAAVRKARLSRRLEEESLKDNDGNSSIPSGDEDWGEEASWTSWLNDMERRRKQLQDIAIDPDVDPRERDLIEKRRRDVSPPKFSRLHFWGFGWWENAKRKK